MLERSAWCCSKKREAKRGDIAAGLKRVCRAAWIVWIVLCVALFASAARPALADRPPNFVVILADDLGWSDIGAYGGEIRTPNLDALALNGLRYTQFYNAGRCWPTRAAIMTGYYAQQVRMDPPSGPLPDWAQVVARPLKARGYRTYHSGKWHVFAAPRPKADGGFDRSYHIKTQDRYFSPLKTALDDRPLPQPKPESGYYMTTAIADYALRFLDEHERTHRKKPFFLYVAFTAPHFPLHALQSDIERYKDTYTVGWDVIRARRLERLKKLGLYDGPLPPLEPRYTPSWNLPPKKLMAVFGKGEVARAVPWDTLTEEQKAFQARKMAIHAAMVDRMDREIGRIIAKLKAMGVWENTVTFFLSDNGASAEQIVRGDGHDPAALLGSWRTYLSIGPGWSSASNTPFRLHKSWVHEGGVATPLIVHWPQGIRDKGGIRHAVGHVVDIPATLVELAGGNVQDLRATSDAPPPSGQSLVPTFGDAGASGRKQIFLSHIGNRGLLEGRWKLVRAKSMKRWALYDMLSDRAELNDLSTRYPELVERLSSLWHRLDARFRMDANRPARNP